MNEPRGSTMVDASDDGGAEVQSIDLSAFSGDIAGVLDRVRGGCSFLVTSSDGQALAELRPPPRPDAGPRRPGALRGQIRMAEDFDAPFVDMMAAIEG